MTKRIQTFSVDLLALRAPSQEKEKDAFIQRMYTVCEPLFPHVAAVGPGYIRQKFFDADAPIYSTATFFQKEGTDHGLVTTRIYQRDINGKRIHHLSIGACSHPTLVGQHTIYLPTARALLWSYLHHPRVPVYVIDVVVSSWAWRSAVSALPEFYPRPGAWIPDSLWPIAEAGARLLGVTQAEGKPRGIVRTPGYVSEYARQRSQGGSLAAKQTEDEFARWVGPGEGILLCAQISPALYLRNLATRALRLAPKRLRALAQEARAVFRA